MRKTIDECLQGSLADVNVSEARHQQMLRDITAPREKRRLSPLPRFAVLLALMLALCATALAATIAMPSLFEWQSGYVFAPALNPETAQTALPTESQPDFVHNGASVTVLEARADAVCFQLHILVEGERYPEADCLYQGVLNEITTEKEDEAGRLHLLMEGLLTPETPPVEGELIRLTLTVQGETAEFPIPVTVLPTLETANLKGPTPLGETGYTLDYLYMTRTALRTKIAWQFGWDVPPLDITLQEPECRLLDAQGREITSFWDYEDAMPIPLTAQMVAKDGSVLYEQVLTAADFTDQPVPFVHDDIPILDDMDDEQSMRRTLMAWRVAHDFVPYICYPLQDQLDLYHLLLDMYPREMTLYGRLPDSAIDILKQEHVMPGAEHITEGEAIALAEAAVSGIDLTDAQQALICIREKDGRVVYEAAWGRTGERIATVRIDALTGEVIEVVH